MNNDLNSKKCGLCYTTVTPSEHNKNGACKCIGCTENNCNNCETYQEFVAEIMASKPWRCIACRGGYARIR